MVTWGWNEKGGSYFAESTLPKKTSSISEGLTEGTRSRAAGGRRWSSMGNHGGCIVHLMT